MIFRFNYIIKIKAIQHPCQIRFVVFKYASTLEDWPHQEVNGSKLLVDYGCGTAAQKPRDRINFEISDFQVFVDDSERTCQSEKQDREVEIASHAIEDLPMRDSKHFADVINAFKSDNTGTITLHALPIIPMIIPALLLSLSFYRYIFSITRMVSASETDRGEVREALA
jgi:hypothetical protein